MQRLIGGRGSAAILTVALVIAMGSLLAACGSSSKNSSSSGSSASASSSGSSGSSSGKGITVKAAQFTWSAATVTNAILAEIAKDHPDLGVAKIQSTTLDPPPAWAGAARGDIDLLTEIAMPNQQALADKAKSKIDMISQTYGNAAQGWFVPAYAVAPGGKLAGLTSVTQLNKYKSALGGKLYDAAPGWVSTQQNTKRLKGYGLGYQHVMSSEAAELSQLARAYQRKQPIVLYLYHPHWVFTKYKMVQLKEPTPYKDNCFTTGNGACAMPAYAAWVAASKNLEQKAPKFVAMLKKFQIPLPDMEQMLAEVDQQKQPAATVAQQWVTKNSQQITSWTAG